MDLVSFYNIFVIISAASILLPNMGGLIVFKRLDIEGKKILAFFAIFIIIEFVITWLGFHKINNMPMFSIFELLEYGFFAYLFYTNIKDLRWKKFIKYASFFYFTFAIFVLIFIRSIYEFNSETRVVESLLLVLFALLYFNELSKALQTEQISINKIPMFWMIIGILFYFMSNFFLFLFYNEISKITPTLWAIHSVVNTATNFLFMLSFLCRLK